MEIYSPNSGNINKFRLNVYKSVGESEAKKIVNEISYTKEKPVMKVQAERKKKENLLMKAVNSCFDVVKQFFEYEEVV